MDKDSARKKEVRALDQKNAVGWFHSHLYVFYNASHMHGHLISHHCEQCRSLEALGIFFKVANSPQVIWRHCMAWKIGPVHARGSNGNIKMPPDDGRRSHGLVFEAWAPSNRRNKWEKVSAEALTLFKWSSGWCQSTQTTQKWQNAPTIATISFALYAGRQISIGISKKAHLQILFAWFVWRSWGERSVYHFPYFRGKNAVSRLRDSATVSRLCQSDKRSVYVLTGPCLRW